MFQERDKALELEAPVRAVVMERHEIVREAIGRMLQEHLDFEQILMAGDLTTGLDLLSSAGVIELIVVDLHLPGSSGPESLSALVERFPTSRIVVMSASETRTDILGSMSAGVDAYIPKSLSMREMTAAISQVLGGGMFVPPGLTRRQPEPERRINCWVAGIDHITPRQRDVVDQLIFGKSSKEIARELGVSEGTVKLHLAGIYRALGVRSRAEAISKLMSA